MTGCAAPCDDRLMSEQKRPAKVHLQFNSRYGGLPRGKKLRDGLSGVAARGESLWFVSDETLTVERLDRTRNRPLAYAKHATFRLEDYLRLPSGSGREADLEDLDIADGYLWLVGSHAAVRQMPGKNPSPRDIAKALGKIERQGNRYLLARIPIVEGERSATLARRAGAGSSKRVAALLQGGAKGNALTRALRKDMHFRDTFAPPSKENGFDVEGIAVVGGRVMLGLRGPVFNEWAVILEIEPRPARGDSSLLRLGRFGPGRKLYRKHFLKLDGLGVRGLCRYGRDILVLAGPTAAPEGPAKVYRWLGGARSDIERRLRPSDLVHVMDLPTGRRSDRPEGIVVMTSPRGRDRILVLYERAAESRMRGAHGTDADLFAIH